ncbi:hypothetical protein Tco_1240391 [Tanacetum coccineum]
MSSTNIDALVIRMSYSPTSGHDVVAILEGVLSTQEYVKIVVEDVGEDEDFKRGSWVSAVEFVNANDGGIVNGCLGDIENYLKNGKLEHVFAIIKSCTPNADLTMTLKDLLVSSNSSGVGGSRMLMEEEEIVKLIEEEEMAALELQVCWNVTHQEMANEETLNLALEEEARQAWADRSVEGGGALGANKASTHHVIDIFLYPLGVVEAACALEVNAIGALDLVKVEAVRSSTHLHH